MPRLNWIFSTLCIISLQQASCSKMPLIAPSDLACRQAVNSLKKRVGPELGKVISQQPLPLSKQSFGCAVTFTRIDEELPGEVAGVYGQTSSHELAIALPSTQEKSHITLLPIPKYREESVQFNFELKELHGGVPQELVVTEQAIRSLSRYKGLQIFTFAEGVPSPREILSESLRFKTVDGITVTADWSFELFEEEEVIIIKGGGDYRIFKWHDALQSFKLDLAASTRYKQNRSSAQ